MAAREASETASAPRTLVHCLRPWLAKVTKQIPACWAGAQAKALGVGRERPMAPLAPGISGTRTAKCRTARRPREAAKGKSEALEVGVYGVQSRVHQQQQQEALKPLRTRFELEAVSGSAPQHGTQRPLIRCRAASASLEQSGRRSIGPSLAGDGTGYMPVHASCSHLQW
ncbi:uncharacterized protein TrAtP1_004001 [Trichoderma atroviride]|uniref:uncharacterized protein n=1 Tax=Hypocrea atroviridis TaxID=63577 RepID=UPI00331E482B|nr:hypothetical protein TrAtP1_004001 [Trichoderma atroviride]